MRLLSSPVDGRSIPASSFHNLWLSSLEMAAARFYSLVSAERRRRRAAERERATRFRRYEAGYKARWVRRIAPRTETRVVWPNLGVVPRGS